MKKTDKIKKDKPKKKQLVIYIEQDEFDYLNFIYNKKYFPTRSAYIRMLINEDREMNGY